MRRLLYMAACAAAIFAAGPAAAVDFFTSDVNPGPKPPAGFETLQFYADFDNGAPAGLTGGSLHTGSNFGIYAAPYGDSSQYYAVGPDDGRPATLLISQFDRVSLYWGSIDAQNSLTFLGPGGSILQTFTGDQIVGSAMQWGAQSRIVTFTLNAAERALVTGIRFDSSKDAFEFDNLAIGSAPEPAVWMTLILGFGLAGGALRRRKSGRVVPRPA